MTQEQIEAGNKLIAEFMGWSFQEEEGPYGLVIIGKYNGLARWSIREGEYKGLLCDGFAFQSKWEKLMPVIEEIIVYKYPDYWPGGKPRPQDADYHDDCPYLRTFGMRTPEGQYMVRFNASPLVYGKSLIEATYSAVIQFITWYNSQSK